MATSASAARVAYEYESTKSASRLDVRGGNIRQSRGQNVEPQMYVAWAPWPHPVGEGEVLPRVQEGTWRPAPRSGCCEFARMFKNMSILSPRRSGNVWKHRCITSLAEMQSLAFIVVVSVSVQQYHPHEAWGGSDGQHRLPVHE